MVQIVEVSKQATHKFFILCINQFISCLLQFLFIGIFHSCKKTERPEHTTVLSNGLEESDYQFVDDDKEDVDF